MKTILLVAVAFLIVCCSGKDDPSPVKSVYPEISELRISVRASDASFSNVNIIHKDLTSSASPNAALSIVTVTNTVTVQYSGLLKKEDEDSSLPSTCAYTLVVVANSTTKVIESATITLTGQSFAVTHDLSSVLKMSDKKIYNDKQFIGNDVFIQCSILL